MRHSTDFLLDLHVLLRFKHSSRIDVHLHIKELIYKGLFSHARIQKVLTRGGPTLPTNFYEGKGIQIALKAGHHRPASETPLNGVSLAVRWWYNIECWFGSFGILQVVRTINAQKPYTCICCDFSGGSGPPPPPIWIRTC